MIFTSILNSFREDVKDSINRCFPPYYFTDKECHCVQVYAEELIDRWEELHGQNKLPYVDELLAGRTIREYHEAGLSPKGDALVVDMLDPNISLDELSYEQESFLATAIDRIDWTVRGIGDIVYSYTPKNFIGRLFFTKKKQSKFFRF